MCIRDRITERIPLEVEPSKYNQAYLETKRDKLGHLLSLKLTGVK